ncbi:hypothetical protein [Soonwooa purpurea]
MLIPYVIFSVYELGYAMNIGFNYNISIIIFSVIFYFIFRKKLFKSKFNNKYIKPLIEGFLTIFGIFIIWMFSISMIAGLALTYNSIVGKKKTINVQSFVLNTEKTKSKNGTIHNYITIRIPEINRTVELKVKNEYQINDIYNDTLKLGSLKMVYKYK